MNKLNTRQIIILAIAALFVLWAAYEFLIADPAAKKAKTDVKPVEITEFVSALNKDLINYNVEVSDAYIAKRAETDWDKSPFWDRISYRQFAGNEAASGAATKIVYSGYVDAGRKKMAIINGWEYEEGESLDVEGYVLKTITQERVLIVNRTTGGELYIPIQE